MYAVTCISIVNRSRLLPDDACRRIAAACNVQLRDHVCPAWDRAPARVLFVARGGDALPGSMPVYVDDEPDIAGVLGYRKEDAAGAPAGRAFVRPILVHKGGVLSGDLSVSAVVSHEVIESLIDPSCQLWSESGEGVLIACEACDPVHGQSYGVQVDGRTVSVADFVLPAWFDSDGPRDGVRYDWLGTLARPFQLGPTGYVASLRRGALGEETSAGALNNAAARMRVRSARRAARHPL